MGRVKRYKKIKACDPFSKKKVIDPKAMTHDESPEEFEIRQKKKRMKENKRLARLTRQDPMTNGGLDLLDDKLLQEQLKRELHYQNSPYENNRLEKQHQQDEKKEGSGGNQKMNLTIRPGESLKAFQKRVEVEKRRILIEEVRKQSHTAQRRKEKLKELKMKKKLKKQQLKDPNNNNNNNYPRGEMGFIGKSDILEDDDDDDERDEDEGEGGREGIITFGSRADGFIRPSDRQDSLTNDFKPREIIPFGEISHAPPNLKSFITQIDKKRNAKKNKELQQQQQLQSLLAQKQRDQEDEEEEENGGKAEELEVEEEEEEKESGLGCF